jgi:hypothetical protein
MTQRSRAAQERSSIDEFDRGFVVPTGLPSAYEQIDRHVLGVLVIGAKQRKVYFVLAHLFRHDVDPRLQELEEFGYEIWVAQS